MNRTALPFVLVLIVFACLATPAYSTQYSVQLLGFLSGGNASTARDINNLGQVTGQASVQNSYPRPFLWSTSTGMVNLGTLGGSSGSATSINNLGVVVGASTPSSGPWSPFSYTQADGMKPIERPESVHCYVSDLNESAVSVGRVGQRAYAWSASGAATYLGTLDPRHESSTAMGVNDSGVVVGTSYVGNYEHGFIWSAQGGMRDLGTGGGLSAMAHDVTEDGYAVGTVEIATFQYRAYMWNPDGTGHQLATLGGESHATRVNHLGYIAGTSYGPNGYPRAVVWDPAGNIITLTVPTGAISSYAYGLNDLGQVAGEVYLNQQWQAAVWTPVPEPASVLSLFSGLAALVMMSLRRRQ